MMMNDCTEIQNVMIMLGTYFNKSPLFQIEIQSSEEFISLYTKYKKWLEEISPIKKIAHVVIQTFDRFKKRFCFSPEQTISQIQRILEETTRQIRDGNEQVVKLPPFFGLLIDSFDKMTLFTKNKELSRFRLIKMYLQKEYRDFIKQETIMSFEDTEDLIKKIYDIKAKIEKMDEDKRSMILQFFAKEFHILSVFSSNGTLEKNLWDQLVDLRVSYIQVFM